MKLFWKEKVFAYFFTDEKGQAVSEYAALMAVGAVLIALLLSSSSCHKQAVSQSFSSAVRKLNQMNSISRRHSSYLLISPHKKIC